MASFKCVSATKSMRFVCKTGFKVFNVQGKSKIKLKPSLKSLHVRHSILKGLQPIRAFTYKGEKCVFEEKNIIFPQSNLFPYRRPSLKF